MDKYDLVITTFNDSKIYFYDVNYNASHPSMLLVYLQDGKERLINYRIIKELDIEKSAIV